MIKLTQGEMDRICSGALKKYQATTALTRTTPGMVFRVTYSRGRVTEAPVQTVNEASEWWCAKRDAAIKNTGRVTTPVYMQIVVNGIVRGHMTYNGNVYGEPVWRSGLKPIYDPAENVA